MKLTQITPKAKQLTKTLIDEYQLTDTRQMGFWLNNHEDSDFIALAVFIQEKQQTHDIECVDDVVALLQDALPSSFFQTEAVC